MQTLTFTVFFWLTVGVMIGFRHLGCLKRGLEAMAAMSATSIRTT